jgi:hypothetical protein
MENIDKIIVDFNDSARKVMASFLEKFRTNANALSRRNDENVFQQLQARYADSLKAELNSLAKSYIYRFKPADMQQLNNRLINSIELYIHEFLRQTRLF